MEEEGHEVSFLRLHNYKIKPCTGCEVCTWLGRSSKPIHCMYKWDEDDFYSLMTKIDACQGLILSAPTYHFVAARASWRTCQRLHCF